MRCRFSPAVAVLSVLAAPLCACAALRARTETAKIALSSSPSLPADPFAVFETSARIPEESPAPFDGAPVLIQHATVLTAAGRTFAPGFVAMQGGLITAVGAGDGPASRAANTVVVDGQGKFVTPGIIDPHSHIGVYPVPDTAAHDDGNELTDPTSAGLRAEHSFWPEDPAIERAVAAGVTTIAVLPEIGRAHV